ncbi:thy-1 membrane glycoprotein [Triplophysa rosa]|uniref:Thy-1 membrane glycoprotein n=1 Tax=Triplophysa rosa TaxID=992332 RepID=A0A9W8C9R0_TRIRA|nr:thy-1 membrane glycoprotein [Triplophysa rosa]KAI7812666.1 Thy-1 membrane glycoprotein precursor [Triplophysa rosa]
MMCYTVIATLCLLGMATAQTSLEITSCLTKEQNLRMICKFTPAPTPDPKISVCHFTSEGKIVASSNASIEPDSTFKMRAKLAFEQKMCLLNLTGLSNDKPESFVCNIKQTASQATTLTATVEKRKLITCSAYCTLQHSGVVFLLVFITSPLMLELL